MVQIADGGSAERAAAIRKAQQEEAARRAREEQIRKAREEAARKAREENIKKAPPAAKRPPADAAPARNGTGDLHAAAATLRKDKPDALPWGAKETVQTAASVIAGGGLIGLAIKATIDGMVAKKNADAKAVVDGLAPKLSEDGQKALQTLSEQGKLTEVDHKGESLTDALKGLQDEGVDPKVLDTVAQQLADPETQVMQVRDATCGVATPQRALAMQNPAEYARMAASLLTKGEATLPNGQVVKVSASNQQAIDKADLQGSERLNALFQSAVMDYANGDAHYDFEKDQSTLHTAQMDSTTSGLEAEQVKKVNEVLLGCPTFDTQALNDNVDKTIKAQQDLPQDQKKDVYQMYTDELDRQLQAAGDSGSPGLFLTVHGGQKQVIADLQMAHHMGESGFADEYHSVFVSGKDAQGNYVISDATGAEQHVPPEEAARLLTSTPGSIGETSGGTTGYGGVVSAGASRSPGRTSGGF